MTKICIVGPSKKYFSGVSAYTICLANALSEKNSVSTIQLRNLLPRFLYPGNKNVDRQDHSLEFVPSIQTFDGMDWNSPLSWLRAYRFLKAEKPDVIVMAWWTSAVAHMELFLAWFNSFNPKARLILEMHEIVDPLEERRLPLRLYSRFAGRLIMNNASAFVVHSDTVKNQAVKIYGLKNERVFVIPHGVYNAYGQTCEPKSAKLELSINESFVILYFGMIRKYKGVPYLVRAFSQLPREIAINSRLIIAGEDWGDEDGLKELIADSPYARQITYQPEFVPDSEIPKYFSAADVVALPYLRSAGSGVASLAMAYGKPIIISDLENIRESLRDYPGATFIPCGDISVITQKMSELFTWQQKHAAVVYTAPGMCGWDTVTDSFMKVFGQGNIAGLSKTSNK